MQNNHKEKTIIGRAERVKFPACANAVLHARIDTGAKTSSIWATDVKETAEGLLVRFHHQGTKFTSTSTYSSTMIAYELRALWVMNRFVTE